MSFRLNVPHRVGGRPILTLAGYRLERPLLCSSVADMETP